MLEIIGPQRKENVNKETRVLLASPNKFRKLLVVTMKFCGVVIGMRLAW